MHAGTPDRVFYDGTCGFCHRGVLFLLQRDPAGRAFRFAPLGGPTFRREVDPAAVRDLPDSFVVITREGRVLIRSDATLYALGALGGVWRAVAALLRAIPRPIRDWGYDRVAAVRKRLFSPPTDACPVVAPDLRARVDP